MEKYVELQNELALLNVSDVNERLDNLRRLIEAEKEAPAQDPDYANNHIHTTFSFSPYSPTAAVYMARAEGLQTAGIVDHDSIAGAEEFRAAGKIAGIGTTCGMECRVSLEGTPLAGRRINSPDQPGIAYMAIHSVPAAGFKLLQDAFTPLREKRNIRNREMTKRMNELMAPYGICVDFDKDVLPISNYAEGGSVTERHLLYALSLKILEAAGREHVAEFVEEKLEIALSDKVRGQLSDSTNPHLAYDLLGLMKAQLVGRIYVPATDECLKLQEVVALAKEAGAILCYAYLGDVTASVTGDKKAAKFEDDFLDELFDMLDEEGVEAVTYMPARNTPEQIRRIQALCEQHHKIQISGEDVNSSRQSMICKQLKQPEFKHLVDMTWTMVNREKD